MSHADQDDTCKDRYKMFLITDDHAATYYIARRSEDQIRPELIAGMDVGEHRMITGTVGIVREQ